MNRWKAFTIHLSISAIVLLTLMGIVIMLWYPGMLYKLDGVWNGLRIVIGVDLVLGPLLTLLVFKTGKPGLKFDLSCIVSVQIACMAAGIWVVYQQRPIALVFAYDTVYSLAAREFEEYGKDPSLIKDFPGPYPKLIYTKLPEDDVSADIVAIRSQFIGDPLFMQTERYQPMPSETAGLFRREKNIRAEAGELIDQEADDRGKCLLSRFVSVHASGYVCFNPEQRKLTRFYEPAF